MNLTKVAVCITGASGVIYGLELVKALKKHVNCYVYLIISRWGWTVMKHEASRKLIDEVFSIVDEYYPEDELDAPIASGSSCPDAVIVCPCSIKTLSSIVQAHCENLIVRAVIVALKQGRQVILVIRETPLTKHIIELMMKAADMGIHIVPACPGFYHKPESINDIVKFVVGKVLEILNIRHDMYRPWRMMSGHGSDK